jgi:hypothetical protein
LDEHFLNGFGDRERLEDRERMGDGEGSRSVRDSLVRRDKDMDRFLRSGTDILDRQIESGLKVIENKIDFGGFER